MSYDVTIGDYEGSYTFNTSAVFYDNMEGGLPSLDGMTGRQASNVLRGFWSAMESEVNAFWENNVVGEPKLCARYDSPNGWGSLVGTLVFAGEITAACGQHPRHRLRVYR